jgi:hypothetical protein
MDRRKMLALLGTSATIGLAGCSGDGDENGGGNGNESENGEANGNESENGGANGNESENGGANGNESENGGANGNESENGEANGEENGEEQDPANLQISIPEAPNRVQAGETVTVNYAVENEGGVAGTQTVVFTVDGEEESSQEVTVGADETTSGEFTYETGDDSPEELTVGVATDDDEAESTVGISFEIEPVVLDGPVSGQSTGGYVAIGEDNKQDALEEGIGLPPSEQITEPIRIEGTVNRDEQSWEASEEGIQFPELDPTAIVSEEQLELLGGTEVAVEIGTPGGLSGEIVQDESGGGRMTLDGVLKLQAFVGQEAIQNNEPDAVVELELNGTTGESGGLTGNFDNSGEPIVVRVVDNTLTVGELDGFVGSIINDELGLPAEEGEVWLELEFELEQA